MKNRIWLVAILATVVVGWNFWGTSVYMLDEAKNAGAALEMMNRNDLVVPTFNGEYHDKPALQYFFMITGYQFFGVNPFSARLFSVIAGILTIVMLYHFVRKILNEGTAFYAAILMIGSVQMAIQFRLAVPDPYLIFFIVTGLLSFYTGYAERRAGPLYVFYACLGLGFLTKGPVAFVLPGIVVLLFLLMRGELKWRTLSEIKVISGIGVALLVGLPWYGIVGYQTNWEWPIYFFVTHNFDRYLNTFEGHGGFLFDVVVIVIVALLPVSFFFPQTLKLAWTSRKNEPFLLFCLSVCISFCGFFLFSQTVLPSYPAPCVPFAAVLLGWYFSKTQERSKPEIQKLAINAVLILILTLALPVVAYYAIQQDPTLRGLPRYAFFFLIAPAGAIVGLFYISAGRLKNAVYSYVISFALIFILVSTFALPEIDGRNPVSKSISLLRRSDLPIAYFQRINSAYVFQLGHTIPKLQTADEVQKFAQGKKVLIISTAKEWNRSGIEGFRTVFAGKDLFESPTSIVVTNDLTMPELP